jgi:hypothetical protein
MDPATSTPISERRNPFMFPNKRLPNFQLERDSSTCLIILTLLFRTRAPTAAKFGQITATVNQTTTIHGFRLGADASPLVIEAACEIRF